jgi:hypothetical protein
MMRCEGEDTVSVGKRSGVVMLWFTHFCCSTGSADTESTLQAMGGRRYLMEFVSKVCEIMKMLGGIQGSVSFDVEF